MHKNSTVALSGTFGAFPVNTKNALPPLHSVQKADIPSHFVNFKVETVQMISEGNHVFSMLHATADGMDADFGHFFKIENAKITEFHIFDDSQKLASIMKAM